MKLSVEVVYASVCLSFAGGFSDAVTFVVVFNIFSQSSRLQANSAKSAIYTVGVPLDIREEIWTNS